MADIEHKDEPKTGASANNEVKQVKSRSHSWEQTTYENRIKAVLADKKRTNKWLAKELGKDPATVSKWCTNVCQPPMETYIKIAQLLDVNLDDLVRVI